MMLVVTLGFAGFLVFSRNNENTNNKTDVAQETTSTSEDKIDNEPEDIIEKEPDFLEIKELGIKIPLAGLTYKDLKYKVKYANGTTYTVASISSESLKTKIYADDPSLKELSFDGTSVEMVLIPEQDFDEWGRVSFPVDGGSLETDNSVININGKVLFIYSSLYDMGNRYYEFRESIREAAKNASVM